MVSNKVILFLRYLLHIADAAQRMFRRADMKLLAGSVISLCSKPIKYPYYSIRVPNTRSEAVQTCLLALFGPSSRNTVSPQRVVTVVFVVTVHRSEDAVLVKC